MKHLVNLGGFVILVLLEFLEMVSQGLLVRLGQLWVAALDVILSMNKGSFRELFLHCNGEVHRGAHD